MEIHLRQLAEQSRDPFDFIERVHNEHPKFLHHNNTAIRELAQIWYKVYKAQLQIQKQSPRR